MKKGLIILAVVLVIVVIAYNVKKRLDDKAATQG
jgi:hypothetical protein